jgi:cell volume regulation protein A
VTDTEPFALIVLLAAAVGLAAVLSSRLTQRFRIPSPALVLIGAAVAVQVIPALQAPPRLAVERVVTVALVCILFERGMHIGWARVPIRRLADHRGGPGWDGGRRRGAGPARVRAVLVPGGAAGDRGRPDRPGGGVLSVLGQREVSRRSGTILGASPARTTRSGSR